MAGEDWEYQVRHRAYELWHAAGRPDGKHQQFWEAAERELKRREAAKSRDQGRDESGNKESGQDEGAAGAS